MHLQSYTATDIKINNNASSFTCAIYPNPSKGNFTIETSSIEKQALQLFDVNGKLVLTQAMQGKSSIDASNLKDGIYNISIISNEGLINKRLVIVR